MTAKIKIRLAAAIMLALSLIGTLGTGLAAAVFVGGGEWRYGGFPHTYAYSYYTHPIKYHSATAIVGGSSKKAYENAGKWAIAEVTGWGTRYVYWNTY